MTDNLPNYDAIEPPDGTPPEEYGTHDRRADLWRAIKAAGSPARVNKAALAREYDVTRKTIYRDMERLREWCDDSLGDDARLTTRAVFETVVDDLLDADDWRAQKAALDAVMDWNEWLADLGEQHREPDKVDAEVRTRSSEVQYRIVREESTEDLPTDEHGTPDFEALGFAEGPVGVEVEATDDATGDR